MKNDKIAVFMKDGALIDSLALTDTIAVYEKKEADWMKIEEHYVNFSPGLSVTPLRAEIRRMAEKLGDCRICAGLRMSGVVYRELDRLGFSIFEIPECSGEVLGGILRDVEEEKTFNGAAQGSSKQPVPTDTAGVYFFDLQRLQEENPELSSKQALKAFLEAVPFYALRLVCAHVPPWLENGPFDIQVNRTADGKTLAVVMKKQCGGQ